MNKIGFVNLTPHSIRLMTDSGMEVIPPSGETARVDIKRDRIESITQYRVPVYKQNKLSVTGLPDPEVDTVRGERTIYLVSSMVSAAVPDREDVLYPTDFVRDNKGNIIAAQGLAR